jgi:hypothetical protein
MTDHLEDMLTNCLHDHADPISAEPGMVGRVDRRSRELRRNRHAVAALAIAPVTAGVAVGAVALSGGHSASHQPPHRVALRPLASSSPSVSAAPKTILNLRPLVDVCSAGTVPHLQVSDQTAPDQEIDPHQVADGQPEIYRLITGDKLDNNQVVLTQDGKTVQGDAILVAANLKDGSTKRDWVAAVFPAGTAEPVSQALDGPVESATFLGCVPPTSARRHRATSGRTPSR